MQHADIFSERGGEVLKLPRDKFDIFNKMMEGVQVIDRDWKYLYLNEIAIKHSKSTAEELIGHTAMEMYPGIEKTEMFNILEKAMYDQIPGKMQNEFCYPDGSIGYFDLFIEPINDGILILSIDVTAQRINEQRIHEANNLLEQQTASLLRSLNEKTVLIKEIHHRVKNNLQIIISLLHLQSTQLNDESHKEVFQSFENKINTIAMIHHMVYAQDTLSTINIRDFTYNFFRYSISKFGNQSIAVRTDINLLNEKVNMDTAISYGLLLNELLSNAIKYGCQQEGSSHVFVELKEGRSKRFILKVGDKGLGIPQDILNNQKEYIGLNLINDLIHQLSGKYKRSSTKNGTVYSISFDEI